MIKRIYFIRDKYLEIDERTACTNKENCIMRFVRSCLPRCKELDKLDAAKVWRIFEKNGWNVIEMRVVNDAWTDLDDAIPSELSCRLLS